MNRVEVFWRPVTNHLLEVCAHPLSRMREWGIEAVTTLVSSAIEYPHAVPLKDNQVFSHSRHFIYSANFSLLLSKKMQTLLISPLNELSSTSFADVRQKQVDCVLHLLHTSGDVISFAWPLFLNIVGAINNSQGYDNQLVSNTVLYLLFYM